MLRLFDRASVFFTIFFMLPFLVACEEGQSTLKVGTNVWTGYEPLYLAEALSAYGASAVQLTQYPSASDVIRAYKNKEIDAAALTLDEVLLMKSEGFDSKVVLVMDFSAGGDVIIARQGINSLKELGRNKIGAEATALGAFVLCRAAQMENLNCLDFNVANMEVNEHEDAFKSQEVAAVVTFEPVRTKLLTAGGKIIFDSRSIPGEIIDVLTVNPNVLQKQDKNLNILLTGWFKALDYLRSSRHDAVKKMSTRQHISAEEFETSLSGIHIPSHEENKDLFNGKKLKQSAENLREILLKSNLMKNSVGISDLFVAEPIGSVNP